MKNQSWQAISCWINGKLKLCQGGYAFPPEGVPTLTQWWGLCGYMILRAMLAVANATGRASHARQVKGDDPDKKGYPGPPGGGLTWG